MRYIIGRDIVVADALTRINVVTEPAVRFDDLAQAQLYDELKELL